MHYACGVWGYFDYNESKMLQNRAQRVFLGVHKFAPLLALEGDMAWLSAKHKRWIEMLRLWNRLIMLPENRLTQKIFNSDHAHCLQGVNNWSSYIKIILSDLDLSYAFNDKLSVDMSSVSKILINTQERNWLNQLPSKPKLRFYTLFKNTLNVENFVKYNLTPSERSLVSQYRMGILLLAIETGRFQGVKLEERLCIFCNSGLVEDEVHFMFDCSLYNDL